MWGREGEAQPIPDLEDSTRRAVQGSQIGVSAAVLQHRLAQSGGKEAVGCYRLRSAPQATHVGVQIYMCRILQHRSNKSRLQARRHASSFTR